MEKNIKHLIELVKKYGTDKDMSSYAQKYGEMWCGLKEDITSILEIGVGTLIPGTPFSFSHIRQYFPHYLPGGSLRVWKDYFKKAEVYGIDIVEDCLIDEERLKTFIADSMNREMCDEQLKDLTFDIVIDDGNHNSINQLTTFQNFFHRVNDDGFYVVEDVGWGDDKTYMYEKYRSEFQEIANNHEFFVHGPLIVIRKTNTKLGEIGYHQFLLNIHNSINPL